MSDFTPIETQEEFDKAIKSRLAQKDREMSEKYKGYLSPDESKAMKADFEKQIEDANKLVKEANDKLSTFDKTVSELTQRAEKAETKVLKTQIANEKHLPIELADRLIGNTKEELEADADNLSGIIKPSGKGAPPLYTGTQKAASTSVEAGMADFVQAINAQLANN